MSQLIRYGLLAMFALLPSRYVAAQQPAATGAGRMTFTLRTPAWYGFALECPDCSGGVSQSTSRERPIVARVIPGGPADRASIQARDTILAVDGKDLSAAELRTRLGAGPAKSTLRLLVGGARGRSTVTVTAENSPIVLLDRDSLPVRYRGEYAEVTVEVMTKGPPVVTRDSAGAMLIRVGDSVIRLQRAP